MICEIFHSCNMSGRMFITLIISAIGGEVSVETFRSHAAPSFGADVCWDMWSVTRDRRKWFGSGHSLHSNPFQFPRSSCMIAISLRCSCSFSMALLMLRSIATCQFAGVASSQRKQQSSMRITTGIGISSDMSACNEIKNQGLVLKLRQGIAKMTTF